MLQQQFVSGNMAQQRYRQKMLRDLQVCRQAQNVLSYIDTSNFGVTNHTISSLQEREARLVAEQMRKFHEDEEKARLKQQRQRLEERALQTYQLEHIDQRRRASEEVAFSVMKCL